MSSSFRTCLHLAIVIILLIFPTDFIEYNLKGIGADATEITTRRAAPKRKFEFHKLTRVEDDDDNDDDENNEDEDDEDDDRLIYSNNNNNNREWSMRKSSSSSENEETLYRRGGGGGSVVGKTPRRSSGSSSSSGSNEKVGKYVKLARETGRVLAANRNNEEEQADYSLFNAISGWLLNSGRPPPPPEPSNGIIDAFKWILSKTKGFSVLVEKTEPIDIVDVGMSWSDYFDRWPFNAIFAISGRVKLKSSSSSAHGERESSANGGPDLSPISQEHFESLLHTLPGFVVNASHIADIDCKQQMQVFHRQLRGNKLWALQMIDSTGKISSGVLRGNINQFGDFDTCTQIRAIIKVTPDIQMRIRGKYCLAHIETQAAIPELKVPVHMAHGRNLWNSHLENPSHFVPRYTVSNWGVCIPHSCPAAVVREMIEANLRPYNVTGVRFFVDVDENDCYLQKDRRISKVMKDGYFTAAVSYLGTLLLTVLAALISEYWQEILLYLFHYYNETFPKERDPPSPPAAAPPSENPEEKESVSEEDTNVEEADSASTIQETIEENDQGEGKEKSKSDVDKTSCKYLLLEIFRSFSPTRTTRQLFSKDRIDSLFPVLHLLKILITFMLYICLKYLMIGHLPITNRDKLVRTLDQPLSIIFRCPLFYADQLLLISGFLSGYSLSEEMEQRTHIGVLKRISAKFLRYLPTLFAIISFQAWIFPHLGSGPLWMNLIDENARLCEKNMWRNFIALQNVIDFEESCLPISSQLALELQLYILGPLIVWLYYTDSDASFFVYGAIHAISVAARYFRTNLEHLSSIIFHGMNLSKFYRTANFLFSSPITRATPYLIGIGAGIWRRTITGTPEVTPAFSGIGWIASVGSLYWCFWYPSSGMSTNFVYNAKDAAAFASWSPLIAGAAMVWIIFMVRTNEDSILGTIANSRAITFLSRIAFPMQLVTFLVVMHNTASVREAEKYHISDLINLSEIFTIIAVSTLLAFLVDVPFQNIRDILVRHLFIERISAVEIDEPMSGVEYDQSEELSEGLSDRLASDSPEPDVDAIPLEAKISDIEEEPEFDMELSEPAETEEEEQLDNAAPEDAVEEEDESEIPEEDEVKRRPAAAVQQLEKDLLTILH